MIQFNNLRLLYKLLKEIKYKNLIRNSMQKVVVSIKIYVDEVGFKANSRISLIYQINLDLGFQV